MCDHYPESLVERSDVTIFSDFYINEVRNIHANPLDIIKDKNVCTRINMIVTSGKNVSVKIFEKIIKYNDLEMEIENDSIYKLKLLCCVWV